MKLDQKGQNMIEYILLFVVVIVVLLIVLGPQGVLTTAIDESISGAVKGIDLMTKDTFEDKK